jgi:hypothetical protein
MRTIEKIYRDLSPGILIKEGDKVLLEDYYPTPTAFVWNAVNQVQKYASELAGITLTAEEIATVQSWVDQMKQEL